MKKDLVYQFKITLKDVSPPIWRRILVPSTYTFWDLHVAIQDAMGWLDYHMHIFSLQAKSRHGVLEVGSPMDDWLEETPAVTPGWQVHLHDHFTEPGQCAEYEYDFGDSWLHEILLEGILLKEKRAKYPKCLGGEGACPPEDCGGIPGYYHLLEVLRNPSGSEYEEMVDWLKGHEKNYYPYEPDEFNPEKVRFHNSKKRLKERFPPANAQ